MSPWRWLTTVKGCSGERPRVNRWDHKSHLFLCLILFPCPGLSHLPLFLQHTQTVVEHTHKQCVVKHFYHFSPFHLLGVSKRGREKKFRVKKMPRILLFKVSGNIWIVTPVDELGDRTSLSGSERCLIIRRSFIIWYNQYSFSERWTLSVSAKWAGISCLWKHIHVGFQLQGELENSHKIDAFWGFFYHQFPRISEILHFWIISESWHLSMTISCEEPWLYYHVTLPCHSIGVRTHRFSIYATNCI